MSQNIPPLASSWLLHVGNEDVPVTLNEETKVYLSDNFLDRIAATAKNFFSNLVEIQKYDAQGNLIRALVDESGIKNYSLLFCKLQLNECLAKDDLESGKKIIQFFLAQKDMRHEALKKINSWFLNKIAVPRPKDSEAESDYQKGQTLFFYAHEQYCNLMLKDHHQWRETLGVLHLFAKNATQISSSDPLIKPWSEIERTGVYNRLLKIYLPPEEYTCWEDHVPRSQQAAYAGDQETFGLWMHLGVKATLESWEEDRDWKKRLFLLAQTRHDIACALKHANMEETSTHGPDGVARQFGTYRLESLSDPNRVGYQKRSVVLFSDLYYFEEYFTRIEQEIVAFEKQHSIELEPTRQMEISENWDIDSYREHFDDYFRENPPPPNWMKGGIRFDVEGREFWVYPPSKKGGPLIYRIVIYADVNGKRMPLTQILWNWPRWKDLENGHGEYFSYGRQVYGLFEIKGWAHVYGKDMETLALYLQTLFPIIKPDLEEEQLTALLKKCYYFESHACLFIRGSASITRADFIVSLRSIGREPPPHP